MAKSAKQLIGGAVVRAYAFIIMAVVVWTGYTAAAYLYRTVFQPIKPPSAMLEWQGQTEKKALHQTEARGITVPAVRAPLGHYHGVDRWFQPDVRNGCISSGCHDPVPHSRSKALRAFANLHATTMTCEVCHSPSYAVPMPAAWANIRTGDKQEPPAILRLIGHLAAAKADAPATEPAAATKPVEDMTAFSQTTIRLLRQAIEVIGGDPALNYLALQIETSEPGSPVWRRAVEQLRSELPNHARGEYGAKISLLTPTPELRPVQHDFGPLIGEYFSRTINKTQREAISQQIHQGVIAAPQGCKACHRAAQPLLDFAALGYTPNRVKALTTAPIAEMMQQIHKGQPFNLPLAP